MMMMMRIVRLSSLCIQAIVLALVTAAVVVVPNAVVVAAVVQDVIDIGNMRPGGIHFLPSDGVSVQLPSDGDDSGGPFALVSEYYYGGVKVADVATGTVIAQLVPSADALGVRAGLGLWYEDGVIFAAGGGGPSLGPSYTQAATVYAYDATTGDTIAACSPDGGAASFFKDIVVVDRITAYITDTFRRHIWAWDVSASKVGQCILDRIPLTDPFPMMVNATHPAANGLVPYRDGLLIVDGFRGGLYWLTATSQVLEVLPPGSVPGGDGLALSSDGTILFVSQPRLQRISAWRITMDDGATGATGATATLLETLVSPNFDDPTSIGIAAGRVYAVNARFTSLPAPAVGEDVPQTFDETFSMTAVMEVTLAPTMAPTAIQDVLDIGNRRPEGIHFLPQNDNEGGGPMALVSEFFYGGVKAVDISTGAVTQMVPPAEAFGVRGGLGLWYEDGVIFSAGGGPAFLGPTYTASVYAYNATTGSAIASCRPEGALFLNDVVVVDGNTAYFTDAFRRELLVWDVAAAKLGLCVFDRIPLSDPFPMANATNPAANGVCEYRNGLLIVDGWKGGLYWLDTEIMNMAAMSNTIEILPPGSVVGGDGLVLSEDNNILYVSQASQDLISAWRMDGTTATFLENLESTDLDGPANIDIAAGYVYAVNSRLSSLPAPAAGESSPGTFNETFTVAGVPEIVLPPTATPPTTLVPNPTPPPPPITLAPTTPAPTAEPTTSGCCRNKMMPFAFALSVALLLGTVMALLL